MGERTERERHGLLACVTPNALRPSSHDAEHGESQFDIGAAGGRFAQR